MSIDEKEWGRRVIDKALQYANHKWYATEENAMHGLDEDGRYVDTPDISWRGEELNCGWWRPDEVNTGIPYSWGNASMLEEFDMGLFEGKYAGNVPEDKSRYGSYNCVGVDCSGLVTVCWDLPRKITTRDIPEIAKKLDNIEDICQGDILAKVGSHVMLFKEFADDGKTRVRIIDAARSTGKVSERELVLAELLEAGYEGYRKR